ncbi:MAG: hypothetical protein ACXADH_01870, partial [Candidatus Kariarchaeaceae archaeon]
MKRKVSQYLPYGLLALLFLLLSSTLTVARPDNTIYPLTNYFAFNDSGEISEGLSNTSSLLDSGLRAHSILCEQPAYKVRLIFPSPNDPFDSLSIRMRMTFSPQYTNRILWGFLRNITVSIYPFDLAILDSENGSVQVINAVDLFEGTTFTFQLNDTAINEIEHFEVSFSAWNGSSVIQSLEFEQIKFQESAPPISSQTNLVYGSIFSLLIGLSFFLPRRFNGFLILVLIFMLALVPITVISRVQSLLNSLPETDSTITRFTFFNVVYERKDYGNGYYSLRKVKDLSTAFELVASSGTGNRIVYPVTIEDQLIFTEQENSVSNSGEGSSPPSIEVISGDSVPKINYLFKDISGSPSWWNSSYKYMKQVTIAADSALSTDYTVQLDLITSTLVSASKMRVDARDLRVAYYSGLLWTELDRVILNNNSVKTSVFFRVQNSISASGSDSNYAIYYGIKSGDPGNPPSNTSNIFLDDDDFSSGNLNDYSPNTDWSATTESTKPTNIGWWTNDDIALGSTTDYASLNRTGLITSNTEILVLLRTTDSAASSQIGLRSNAEATASGTVDRIRLEHNSSYISLTRYNSSVGAPFEFDTDPSGFTTSTWYFYKFQIVGSTLKGKVWAASTTEPAGWDVISTESDIPSSGHLVFWSSTTGEDTDIGMWAVTAAVVNAPTVTVDLEEKEIPEITQILITNDDSGEIHAQRQEYNFQVKVTESVIPTDWVVLNFTISSFEYSFGYDNSTDSFTEITDNAANYFILNTTSSSISRSGKVLTVNFKIKTDWDLPNAVSIQLGALANDTNGNWSTGNSGATTYDFNHNIQVSSFNVDDQHINPNYPVDLYFTGDIYYEGTTLYVPDEEITSVSIYREAGASDVDKTTSIGLFSDFNVSADSELSVGSYDYYPEVGLDGITQAFEAIIVNVVVDRVVVTDILISNFIFNDTVSEIYWEETGAFNVTVIAEWDYAGTVYQGEVLVGTTNDNTTYGATSDRSRTDIIETTAVGEINLVNITVGFAVIGGNNEYGTEVIISTNLPEIGWDNDDPNIDFDPGATNESSEFLYYDLSSVFGYYSDNMGGTATSFNVGGTASDGSGITSGLTSIIDNTNFGGNPALSGSSTLWSFEYNITSADFTYGSFTITYTATDNVGNTNSTTFQFYYDSTAPTLGTLNLILNADSDSVGNSITPDTGYYDDDSVDVTLTGSVTDSGGSGLPTARYSYKYDGGSYSSWLSGGTTVTTVPEGAQTIYVQVRDNVGNNASDIDSVAVIVDLTNPAGYSKGTFSQTTVNALYYLYSSGTSVYFNGAYDDLGFDIGLITGTEINFWKVRQPAAFGESTEELTVAPFRRVVDYN